MAACGASSSFVYRCRDGFKRVHGSWSEFGPYCVSSNRYTDIGVYGAQSRNKHIMHVRLDYDRMSKSLRVFDDRTGVGNFTECSSEPLTRDLPVSSLHAKPLYFFCDTCTGGQGATIEAFSIDSPLPTATVGSVTAVSATAATQAATWGTQAVGDSGRNDGGRANRAMDAIYEDGGVRNPLGGMFPKDRPVRTLDEALAPVGATHPNLHPQSGVMVKVARKHMRKLDRSKMAALSDDRVLAIILYTMEDTPRENSLYFAVNAALRAKNRGAVQVWADYIWLLLHALRQLPATEERMVYRGLKFESGLALKLPEIVPGTEQTWSAFSSTASKAEVMKTFLGDSGERILYNIELIEPIARDVRDFSLFPSENELLLPPNFSFEVVSEFNAGNGMTFVQCKQSETCDVILAFD